jgi:hypothetical protein
MHKSNEICLIDRRDSAYTGSRPGLKKIGGHRRNLRILFFSFFVALRLCARILLFSAEALTAAAQSTQVSLFELLVITTAGADRTEIVAYFPVRAV